MAMWTANPGYGFILGSVVSIGGGLVVLIVSFLVIRSSLRKMRTWRQTPEQNRADMTSPNQAVLTIVCAVSALVLAAIGVGVWIYNFNLQTSVPANVTVRPAYTYPENFFTVTFAIIVGVIFLVTLALSFFMRVVKTAVVESKREIPENLRRAKEQTAAKMRQDY